VKTRNVTLALPDDLVRKVKVIAAQRDTSISAILAAQLQRLADDEEGYLAAMDDLMTDLRRGYDLGTQGQIQSDRDSLHER
jgi:predicted transcriptional regulator